MNEINDDKNQFEEQEQEKMKMETKLKEKDVMIDKLIKQINQNIENRKLEQKGVPQFNFDRFGVSAAPFFIKRK